MTFSMEFEGNLRFGLEKSLQIPQLFLISSIEKHLSSESKMEFGPLDANGATAPKNDPTDNIHRENKTLHHLYLKVIFISKTGFSI